MRKISLKMASAAILLSLMASSFMLFESSGQTGSDVTFSSLLVETDIMNHYAMTTWTAELSNNKDTAVEVAFDVKVPQDAMLSNLSLTIDGITSYAVVKEKEEAQQDYDEAKENGTTATKISSSNDPARFSALLNIKANADVSFSIRYEQIIVKELGSYKFQLPLNTFSNTGSYQQMDVEIELRTTGTLIGLDSQGGSVHPSESWISPYNCRMEYATSYLTSSENIMIQYIEEAPPINVTLVTFIDGSGKGYFMHVFSPQLEDLGNYLPKDIIFVLDRSGSMEGRKIEQLKDAFEEIIGQLHAEDNFNIITFSSDVSSYPSSIVPASQDNKDSAVSYIKTISASGSTNLNEALETGLETFQNRSEALPIIVFLSDGLPTVGVVDLPSIRENVRDANTVGASIYSLGFGEDLDFNFLSALSLENNGHAVKIPESTDASNMMQGFYETISVPLLMEIYFSYTGGSFDVLPTYVPSLFEGSETVVVGRFDSSKERIVSTVTGQTHEGQRVFEESWVADNGEGKDFIARLWAHRMIRMYRDQITVQGETENLRNKIVELAVEYSFVTPYTSFILVIEEQRDDEGPQDGTEFDGEVIAGDDDIEDVDDDPTPPSGDDDNDGYTDDRNGDTSSLGDDDDADDATTDAEKQDGGGWNPFPMDGGDDDGAGGISLIIPVMIALVVLSLLVAFVVFGYSRIRKEDLLNQENRKKIYQHIKDNPATHFRGIQRAVDLEVGVLSHHLNVLEKEQLIVSEQDGNNRLFWCAGEKDKDDKVRLSRIQENILKSIEKEPGITQSQIAKRVGVSRKVVFYHVKFLRNSGVVKEEKVKRQTHYYPRE
ncbi:MAG: VIT domain-containing protein [Thermoplasmatota archaeon]